MCGHRTLNDACSMGGFKIENVSQNLFRKLTKFVTQKVGVSKLRPETNYILD